jgi:hypothetical protein
MAKKKKGDSAEEKDLGPVISIEEYETSKDLAVAVFQKCDVAKIAAQLLSGDAAKCGSVRARVWEKLVELYYGKASASSGKDEEDDTEFRVVWDIPPLPETEQH